MAMAVLAVCALAACTNDPADPPTTPPVTSAAPSPSATPTPTPTPDAAVPPERPDMSRVDTATAEAVAVYFLELYPYVLATADLADWDALSHPDCVFCGSVRQGVLDLQAAGRHSVGGLVTVGETRITQTSDDMWLVQFRMEQAPSSTVDANGTASASASAPTTYDVGIAVAADTGQVLIREVTPTRVE